MSKQKRFLPLKSHKGIRKDTQTGQYVVRKRIGEKQYCRTFSRLADAVHWRKHFHPLLVDSEVKGFLSNQSEMSVKLKVQSRPNGANQQFSFAGIFDLYQKHHFPLLEKQSKDTILKYAKNFFPELVHLKMYEVNPEVIDAFMEVKIQQARKIANPRRYSFKKDLKCLKSLLIWYRENYDGMFVVPILRRHFARGIIQKVPKRNKQKMSIEQVKMFLNGFDDLFWRDFAEMQFFMAARVQEVGGLQWSSVDFDRGLIRVEDVSVWGERKKFTYLKETPKNGDERVVSLNKQMFDILMRRHQNKSNIPCEFERQSSGERLDFVFERNGQPVSYRSAQHRYNIALKKVGLFPRFRSTHILRKAMANIVRQELGLDAAQVVGGWKSRSVVERVYTDAPVSWSQKAVDHVGRLIAESGDLPPCGDKKRRQARSHLTLL